MVLLSLFELRHVAVTSCEAGRGYVPAVPVSYDESSFIEERDPFLDAAMGARGP